MTMVKLSTRALLKQGAQGYVFFLKEGFSFSSELKEVSKKWFPQLRELFKKRKFTGALGSSVVIPIIATDSVSYLLFIGCGKQAKQNGALESLRRAVGSMIKTAEQHSITTLAMQLPASSLYGTNVANLVQQIVTTAHMTDYRFDDFKSEKKASRVSELTLIVSKPQMKSARLGLKAGDIIGAAVNNARHLVDTPPSILTPFALAQHARNIAKKHKLSCTVFSETDIRRKGMGGLAAVSAGSEQDCKLIILEYKASKNAPTIALVGKGITFDSGGLSLKPPAYMETMKEDMSGAAVVVSAMQAIAQLKPKVNVVAIAPVSENLPSGTATKPGDIITFYNGKTAEVKNTDAEGRLVLADALAYAEKHYKPQFMIDLATLTGACAHALGPFFSGLISQDESVLKKVQAAAARSGDRVWPLPMDNDYLPSIKTPVADVCNIGKPAYKAGAVTAGFFLKTFVEKTPWVHLDIAGTAFNVPDISYYRPGATGVGVRLLVDLVCNWK